MKRLVIKPDGWICTFEECRPGHFLTEGDYLCFKSEYKSDHDKADAYNEAGEYFWGGTTTTKERNQLKVQPVTPEWEEYEE